MKLFRHLPNTITCLNLLSGSLGVLAAVRGDLAAALWLMLLSAVFDFCDGFSARLLKAYSPMGKELDSLADLVSFGLLPALMLVNRMETAADLLAWPRWTAFLPLAIAAFSALRLARFNLDERQTVNFRGLPTPAAALLTGTLLVFASTDSEAAQTVGRLMDNGWFPLLYSGVLCALLVCDIPMFSLKFKSFSFKENRIRYGFLAGAGILAAAGTAGALHWTGCAAAVLCWYLVLNILGAVSGNGLEKF